MKYEGRHRFFPITSATFVMAATGTVSLIGCATLLGWAMDVPVLRQISPRWNAMSIASAVCFLMSSFAVFLLQRSRAAPFRRIAACMLGSITGILGLISVTGYIFHLQTGNEMYLGAAPLLGPLLSMTSGMAVITGINFSLIGCALVLLGIGGGHSAGAGHLVMLPASVLAYLVFVGYVLDVRSLYDLLGIEVAFNTDIAFMILCAAVFMVRTDTWLMRYFAGDDVGGFMARRLLPALLGLPLLIGWLRIEGERTGLFTSEIGVALVAISYTLSFACLVWVTARSLHRTDLARRQAETFLRQSEERFRLLFQQAAVGIKRLDPQGRFLEVNDKLCSILGYSRDELLGLSVRDITHEDDFPLEWAEAMRLLAGEIPSYSIEKRCVRKDGSIIWSRVTSSRPLDSGEAAEWWISIFEDITQRRQAEEEARRTATELIRSNRDLEQFAYVASHDLQEPLRAVAGFMGILRNRCWNGADAEARDFIKLSIEGAERMQTLINDLLTFSRAGSRMGNFAPLYMKDALDAALKNLLVAIEENGVIVTADTLPTITADASQMTQLLQNLISNAIKFRRRERPDIHISARRGEGRWIFSIRDNGIGIENQYFERIFMIFQRLHSRSEYGGNGIGLAVCKRIVERHNGAIWVESKPGEGSIFYFSIPDKGGGE